MTPPPPNPLLAAALGYAADGLEVFPVNEATKTPYTTHGMNDATTDAEQIERWWASFPKALVGCRVPEDVVILDTDPRHDGGRAWLELERQNHPIKPGRVHASGRNDGGRHNWFRRPNGKLSIKKLDAWAKANGIGKAVGKKWTAGIDILHHGHRYTILPPSPHPETAKPYRWIAEGEPGPMPEWLAELIVAPDVAEPERPAEPKERLDSIADWYSQAATWAKILDGWTLVDGNGEDDGSKWRHPTATAAYSATVRHGCLFVYSPNTGLEETEQGDPHGYTKFRAWAELWHNGDLSTAASDAYEQRDGPREDLSALAAELDTRAAPPDPAAEVTPDYDDDLRALLVDWGEFWKVDHNAVDWLIEPIIASQRAHALFAPGGTGKSLLSLWLAACAATGRPMFDSAPARPLRVLYLDYEMTSSDLAERLESMGFAPGDDLTNLHYALLPSLPGLDHEDGGKAVVRLARLVDAELVIIDTFGRAVHGDENDADTVRAWFRWTGIHLKHDGRAFLRVDHAGKDLEKGQRGTSAKNDDVDVVWQMTASGDDFTLKARKRRMGWVPDVVRLVRSDEPTLSYALTSGAEMPAGTHEAVVALDELSVSPDASNREAARLLRDAGRGKKNAAIRAAQNIRRRAVESDAHRRQVAQIHTVVGEREAVDNPVESNTCTAPQQPVAHTEGERARRTTDEQLPSVDNPQAGAAPDVTGRNGAHQSSASGGARRSIERAHPAPPSDEGITDNDQPESFDLEELM